jgi:hypothetical protein
MAERKPRTPEQKARRRERDRERNAEVAESRPPPQDELAPIPRLKVQRMGKLFRIAYAETRNLAKFNSGEPVDEGGFAEELDAQIFLTKVIGEHGRQTDAEVEGVG